MRRPSTTNPASTRAATLAIGFTAAIVLLTSTGCYRKVVGARGLGTTGVQVQEPSPPSLLDRLIGPEPTQDSGRPRMRVN